MKHTKINLSLRYGTTDLNELPLSTDALSTAEELVRDEDAEINDDVLAEQAYLVRQEIFDQLKLELPLEKKEGMKRKDEVLSDPELQTKIAYFRALVGKIGQTMTKHAERHDLERADINGKYEQYQKLAAEQKKKTEELHQLMRQLFSARGKDPSALTVRRRSQLEKKFRELEESMSELKKSNTDIAALLQYDKIREYARELADTGFIWTASRRRIFEQAMDAALSSRPAIVLMGESGTGKTALVSALSRELTGRDPYREVGQSDLKLPLNRMLVNRSIDKDGAFWSYNGLLQAMTGVSSSKDVMPKHEGAVFFDDEFNKRPSAVQMEVLKFVAEAKPGRKVTIPGTDLQVTVQPKFLYVAAGNPPGARYDREDTPVEAYRELSGVIQVDYLEQDKYHPELMELMVSALLDQKTGRLRLVSKEEIMPSYQKDGSGKYVLDETPGKGGFLWHFANAWKDMFNAFSGRPTLLSQQNPSGSPEQFQLQKFILDPGKVRDWIMVYKGSPGDQYRGITDYLMIQLMNEIENYPEEDQKLVRAIFRSHGIPHFDDEDHDDEVEYPKKDFTVLTPTEHGYLFPNVPRKPEKNETPMPTDQLFIMPDGTELKYVESLPKEMEASTFYLGCRVQQAGRKNPKKYKLLGTVSGAGVHQDEFLLAPEKAKGEPVLPTQTELEHGYEVVAETKKKTPKKPESKELKEFLEKCEKEYGLIKAMYQRYELFIPGTEKIEAADKKEYEFPSWDEVRARVAAIPDLEKKLKNMLEPELNIAALIPLTAYQEAIDSRRVKGQGNCKIFDRVNHDDLRYEIKSADSKNHGGITKEDLSERQKGFIVSIDEAVEDEEYMKKLTSGPKITITEARKKFFEKQRDEGLRGMIPEQYLMKLMRNLNEQKQLPSYVLSNIFTNIVLDGIDETPECFLAEGVISLYMRANEREYYSNYEGDGGSHASLWAPALDEAPTPENEDGAEILKSLESQYPKRVETLEYFEFFKKGTKSVEAIDNKLYPMPTWEEINAAITPDHLQKIKDHIPNPHLLVVPIGMPLEKMSQKVSAKAGKLPQQNPITLHHPYIGADMPNRKKEDESLRYFADDYTPTSGMSKSDLLTTTGGINRFPGWQVLVVSGDKQFPPETRYKSAREAILDFKKKGLDGLHVDEWLLLHADMVREGNPIDVWGSRNGGICMNLANYFSVLKAVPNACWYGLEDRVKLAEKGPGSHISLGARAVVRIF